MATAASYFTPARQLTRPPAHHRAPIFVPTPPPKFNQPVQQTNHSRGAMSPVPPELLPEGVQGLVFDMDGTLVDSMELHYDAWRATCDAFGMKLTKHILVELAGAQETMMGR